MYTYCVLTVDCQTVHSDVWCFEISIIRFRPVAGVGHVCDFVKNILKTTIFAFVNILKDLSEVDQIDWTVTRENTKKRTLTQC
jgi:hypothetical protein